MSESWALALPFLKVGPRTQLGRWIPLPHNFGFCYILPENNLSYNSFFVTKLAVWGLVDPNFIRISELIDIHRQLPCHSAGASFLAQSFVLYQLLKLGNARIELAWFTLLNDASRWTLSFPNFHVVSRALVEFVLLSTEQIFSDENLETRNPNERTPSLKHLHLSHHFSSTFCWAARQPQRVGIDICRHMCILIQTCT